MSWPDFVQTASRIVSAIGWAFSPLLLLPFIFLLFPKNAFLKRLSTQLVLMIDAGNYRLGEAVKWALPLLVLTVAFSVFALSIFGLSWTKLTESTIYMHAGIIMLGSAATLMAGQHVRVDIFYDKMTPKHRALVDFCGFYLLLLPVCLIILWNSESFVGFAWQNLEGSTEADGLRGTFLLKTLIPVFCLTMTAQGLAISLRAAMALNDLDRPARPPGAAPFFGHQDIET